MLDESQFPTMDADVCEAAKYALLWASKELTQAIENKLF